MCDSRQRSQPEWTPRACLGDQPSEAHSERRQEQAATERAANECARTADNRQKKSNLAKRDSDVVERGCCHCEGIITVAPDNASRQRRLTREDPLFPNDVDAGSICCESCCFGCCYYTCAPSLSCSERLNHQLTCYRCSENPFSLYNCCPLFCLDEDNRPGDPEDECDPGPIPCSSWFCYEGCRDPCKCLWCPVACAILFGSLCMHVFDCCKDSFMTCCCVLTSDAPKTVESRARE